MLDANGIKLLCNNGERNFVDYKGVIHFSNADEDKKSELLKDILAFANSCIDSSGYILHGVQEMHNKTGRLGSPIEFLDTAKVSQFINEKVNRRIKFDIYTVPCDNETIQVIEIFPQYISSPFWSLSDYGKVRKNIVYSRDNTGTIEKTPDEIIQMDVLKGPKVNLTLSSAWLLNDNVINIFQIDYKSISSLNNQEKSFIRWLNQALRCVIFPFDLYNESMYHIGDLILDVKINSNVVESDFDYPQWPIHSLDYDSPELPFIQNQDFLNPGEKFTRFDEVEFYVKDTGLIEMEIRVLGDIIRKPIVFCYEFSVKITRIKYSPEIFQFFQAQHEKKNIVQFVDGLKLVYKII